MRGPRAESRAARSPAPSAPPPPSRAFASPLAQPSPTPRRPSLCSASPSSSNTAARGAACARSPSRGVAGGLGTSGTRAGRSRTCSSRAQPTAGRESRGSLAWAARWARAPGTRPDPARCARHELALTSRPAYFKVCKHGGGTLVARQHGRGRFINATWVPKDRIEPKARGDHGSRAFINATWVPTSRRPCSRRGGARRRARGHEGVRQRLRRLPVTADRLSLATSGRIARASVETTILAGQRWLERPDADFLGVLASELRASRSGWRENPRRRSTWLGCNSIYPEEPMPITEISWCLAGHLGDRCAVPWVSLPEGGRARRGAPRARPSLARSVHGRRGPP